MMPDNVFSTETYLADFLDPHARSLKDPLIDYAKGGIALNDPSEGLNYQVWRAYVTDEGVWVRRDGIDDSQLVIAGENIDYVSLSFDQNMNPAISYRQADIVKLYWFDTVASAMVTTEYPMASVGCLVHDDVRDSRVQNGKSDILFFTVENDMIQHRRQRDRYSTLYPLANIPIELLGNLPPYCEEEYCDPEYVGYNFVSFAPAVQINAGMNRGNRLQIEVAL
jgi:hypothetical protein